MRDRGYNFRWSDKYCPNLFARGFEGDQGQAYDAVTAFEVMEHLTNPLIDLHRISQCAPYLIFTTAILPSPPPKAADWWYYLLDQAQHVSFYTSQSLEVLGKKLGYHFTSDGSTFHAFSKKAIAPRQFRRLSSRYCRWILPRRARRKSRVWSDHQLISGKVKRSVSLDD